ncbi:MAG: nickel-dependent hydrogenase large subunit [Anaerolineaceae bacterium]|nr:nickel-dependent hydrogenase large subunit [Anaerolineaceae bacterium]
MEVFDQNSQSKFIVPIGPQHPALKEPGHFEFTIDGEIITGATARLGYVHRGIEKGAESMNWTQDLYLLERICGICSHIHAIAYCQGVEKLIGIEIPPRARAIRTIIAELERIHSHMLWWGVAAHEGGFDTLFMYTWRDREIVMDLLESISGNRVNYSLNLIGGVKRDLTDEHMKAILDGMDQLEKRTQHYLEIVTTDRTFLARTKGIGLMTREQAQLLGAVGPTARASNVNRDVRADAPYAGYVDYPINVISDTAGDLEARFVVRIKELFESYRIIREVINHIPDGDLRVERVPRRVPAGNTISRVEAPRGELFYYIESDGTDKPQRIKVRTPTLPNWGSVLTMAAGLRLADVPMLLVGIDPCFSCNDRMIMIDGKGKEEFWTWNQLREYGIEYYK